MGSRIVLIWAIPILVAVAGYLVGRQLLVRFPGPMRSIWVVGVIVPLLIVVLPALILIPNGMSIPNFDIVLAVLIGAVAWLGYAARIDTNPPAWGSRKDLLTRLQAVVGAAFCGWFALREYHDTHLAIDGVVAGAFAVVAVGLLVMAIATPPAKLQGLMKPR
jgi:hypothetical protein